MIQEIDELTKAMEDDFWNKANTWRQVIKKGLAYWSKTKRGSTRRKTKGTSKNQEKNNTEQMDFTQEERKQLQKEWDNWMKQLYPEDKNGKHN